MTRNGYEMLVAAAHERLKTLPDTAYDTDLFEGSVSSRPERTENPDRRRPLSVARGVVCVAAAQADVERQGFDEPDHPEDADGVTRKMFREWAAKALWPIVGTYRVKLREAHAKIAALDARVKQLEQHPADDRIGALEQQVGIQEGTREPSQPEILRRLARRLMYAEGNFVTHAGSLWHESTRRVAGRALKRAAGNWPSNQGHA